MIRLFKRRKVKRRLYAPTPDELDEMIDHLQADYIHVDSIQAEELHWPLDKTN